MNQLDVAAPTDFAALAEDVLDTFAEAAEVATAKLAAAASTTGDGLAAGNSFTDAEAFRELRSTSQRARDVWEALRREPAISRLVIENETGDRRVLYIARKTGTPLRSGKHIANYDTPMGRLAELDVGDEEQVRLPGGVERYCLIEKTLLHPRLLEAGWDSTGNQYLHVDAGSYSIRSLRELLQTLSGDAGDDLDRLLEKAAMEDGIKEGISHQVRVAMGLRDQPILDKFQGEIFRLPLDSQLIILGPPGTGKTTTLIKRLGQKLDADVLDEHDRRMAGTAAHAMPHESNWMMFTPSELLKHYLKEAFAREQVPAPDARIQTWDSYRVTIARNTLGILRSATGGRYTLRPSADHLAVQLQADPREWFEAFNAFHDERLRKQLRDGADMVAEAAPASLGEMVRRLVELTSSLDGRSWLDVYRDLEARETEARTALDESKAAADRLLKGERNRLFNNDKEVFGRLALFLATLQQEDEPDDDEEFDDDEPDAASEQVGQTSGDIQGAVKAYLGALRSLSRSRYRKRSMPKDSRAARVVAWLGDKVPDDAVLTEIGQRISFQNGLRRFVNAFRRHISDVPSSYRVFRKQALGDERFYREAPPSPLHLAPMELDAVILLMLRNSKTLLGQSFVARNVDAPRFEIIKRISSLFRTQIMVDEATDFSVLQLACMEGMAALPGQSFFACGDFNQRVTSSGMRSIEQLSWISRQIVPKKINVIYRQSRSLNKVAGELLRLMGGDMSAHGEIPAASTHEGVKPALLEHGGADPAAWIADRIMEVERTVRQMPTIAVLVNTASEVKPMAEKLSRCLEPINLKAVACDERVLGEGTDVRVFEIKHIKGLEFEAVFFVGVDSLAKSQPELFDRYLYVGFTRAATYLGMVCENELPTRLVSLRPMFCDDWNA